MTTTSTITPELLDQLLANYKKPEDLTGEDGLFKQLKKALIERALGAELTEHLGYEKGDPAGRGSGNSRNGTSPKTVLTEDGEIELSIPRDRAGSFEPQLIAKTLGSATRLHRYCEGHARRTVSQQSTQQPAELGWRELVARVRKLLHRPPSESAKPVRLVPLVQIRRPGLELVRGNQEISLLLQDLLSLNGEPVASRPQLGLHLLHD